MSNHLKEPKLLGLLAEYSDTDRLLDAARAARKKGFTCLDAHSPFPVHGIDDILFPKKTRLPFLVFIAGVMGCIGGYFLQYWTTVIDYPLNVAGRPLNSIPAFIPITFEMTILLASLTAAVGMLILNGFPRPYNPLFSVKAFEKASFNKFFLYIKDEDPEFEKSGVETFLQSTKPDGIHEVWE